MTADTASVAEWVWRQQSIWSQTANRLKRDLTRSRAVALALTIAGAVLATLGSQVATVSTPAGKALLWAAAVAIGFVPVIRPRFGRQAVEVWARARSASESMKEQIYTYLAAVSPYRDADRDQQLRERADATLAAVDDLLPRIVGIEPASRSLPAVHDVGSYVATRVTGQIHGYYRAQAGQLRDRLRWLRGAELVLAVAAVILSATAGSLGVEGAAAWVPVITTISAALAAHVAAARYEFLLVEYTRTAAQLQRLRDRRHPVGEPEQVASADDTFVAECERVISAQNEAWMAKLTSDPE
jgi:SMODS and SLOG-associating 2TM effector domain 1/Protein of unknown function (DUF4231)